MVIHTDHMQHFVDDERQYWIDWYSPWPETGWPEPELPGQKPLDLCVPRLLRGTVNQAK